MEWLGDAGLVTGIVAAGGAVVAGLNKLGYVHFGEQKHECPDPECNDTLRASVIHVADLKKDFDELKHDIYPKINSIDKAITGLSEYIRGKLG